MTRLSFAVTSLAVLTALAPSQDAPKPGERVLTTEGIRFMLPAPWVWQSEFAANIAIKQDIKTAGDPETITAELIYDEKLFLEEEIKALQAKVAASKGDLRDLVIKRNEKFNNLPAVLCTWIKARGEPPTLFEEREWLVKRGNALLEWSEENAKSVASAASAQFGRAREAVKFTKSLSSDVAKDAKFPEIGLKYVMPMDFEWLGERGKVPTTDEGKTLFESNTAFNTKAGTGRAQFALGVQKWKGAPKDALTDASKKNFTEKTTDITNQVTERDVDLKGEKGVSYSYNGKPTGADGRTYFFRHIMVKHKGYLIHWEEIIPLAPVADMEAIAKKARSGLTLE